MRILGKFYTSSATEYRVRLMKDGAVEWTGYVTPDSFSESLQYRGSVTIIARDNLGALQDFEYDATSTTSGMIYHHAKALAAVSFPCHINHCRGKKALSGIKLLIMYYSIISPFKTRHGLRRLRLR